MAWVNDSAEPFAPPYRIKVPPVLISLMATVSALPYTLFTLPAGAVADIVDHKKILLVVQLWWY